MVEDGPRSRTRLALLSLTPPAVLFLNELEEILEFIGGEQLDAVYVPLFRCIAKCVGSAHFQVAERALFLWNNDQLLAVRGALLRSTRCASCPRSSTHPTPSSPLVF